MNAPPSARRNFRPHYSDQNLPFIVNTATTNGLTVVDMKRRAAALREATAKVRALTVELEQGLQQRANKLPAAAPLPLGLQVPVRPTSSTRPSPAFPRVPLHAHETPRYRVPGGSTAAASTASAASVQPYYGSGNSIAHPFPYMLPPWLSPGPAMNAGYWNYWMTPPTGWVPPQPLCGPPPGMHPSAVAVVEKADIGTMGTARAPGLVLTGQQQQRQRQQRHSEPSPTHKSSTDPTSTAAAQTRGGFSHRAHEAPTPDLPYVVERGTDSARSMGKRSNTVDAAAKRGAATLEELLSSNMEVDDLLRDLDISDCGSDVDDYAAGAPGEGDAAGGGEGAMGKRAEQVARRAKALRGQLARPRWRWQADDAKGLVDAEDVDPSLIMQGAELFRAGGIAVLFLIRLLGKVRARKLATLPAEQQEALDMLTVRTEAMVACTGFWVLPAHTPTCARAELSLRCQLGVRFTICARLRGNIVAHVVAFRCTVTFASIGRPRQLRCRCCPL